MFYALGFLIGSLFFANKSSLDISNYEIFVASIIIIFATLFFKKFTKTTIILVFIVLGYIYSLFYANSIFVNKVPHKFHNQKVLTTGVISSLIDNNPRRDRFIFQTQTPFKAKLRLSFYGKNRPSLKVGQQWQFEVKIKTNNSYQNEASFDYEKWLFSKKIVATGYISNNKANQLITQTSNYKVNQIRENIQTILNTLTQNLEFKGLISALLIGEKSAIHKEHKELLIQTGTSHLSVISGLHLGMIASSVFFIFILIFSHIKLITNNIPIIIPTAILAIITTFFYMSLAGFSTPTVRAFIMIAVFMLAIILRLNILRWKIYFLAMFMILLVNPFSVLEIGFWLSFIAAGIIIYLINFDSSSASVIAKIWQIIYLQIGITILMSPVLIWFFAEFFIVAPLANIVLIPIFSFIIVPLSFIALLLSSFESIATSIFTFIDIVLHYSFTFLHWLENFNTHSNFYLNDMQISALIIVVIFLFLPYKLWIKPLTILIIIAIFLTPQTKNNHLYILDVGQGSSAVFAIDNQAILFDAGNKFSSGFSLGSAVVVPFLQHKNIDTLDKIIISHQDRDHRGGVAEVLAAYPTSDIITSNNNRCIEDNFWKFKDWNFEILTTDNRFNGNNNSCVIKATKSNKSILFTGDIEKKAEKYLIKKYGERLQSDILIVPHHGSKTSSSIEFLHKVKPKIAIISAGFQNAFGHPHQKVISRYKNLKIPLYSTACSGRISIDLNNFNITEYRKEFKKFYHRNYDCYTS